MSRFQGPQQSSESLSIRVSRVKDMRQSDRDMLNKLDSDGKGELTHADVIGLLRSHRDQKHHMSMMVKTFIVVVIVLGVLLAANVAATFAVVQMTKEDHVHNGELVSAANGEVVQVANADMSVSVDGVLTSRKCDKLTSCDGDMKNATVAPVAVVENKVKRSISSVIPGKLLAELVQISLNSKDGVSELYLRVLGVMRVVQPNSRCGSVVRFFTNIGVLLFDDDEVSVDVDAGAALDAAGFVLGEGGVGNGRRLAEQVTAAGFFNFFQNYDWKCDSLAAPKFFVKPYHNLVSQRHPCIGGGCASVFTDAHGQPMYKPGFVDVAGDSAIVSTVESVATDTHVIRLVKLPNHPYISFVGVEDWVQGLEFSYQLGSDGRARRCSNKVPFNSSQSDLSGEYTAVFNGYQQEKGGAYLRDFILLPNNPQENPMVVNYADYADTLLPRSVFVRSARRMGLDVEAVKVEWHDSLSAFDADSLVAKYLDKSCVGDDEIAVSGSGFFVLPKDDPYVEDHDCVMHYLGEMDDEFHASPLEAVAARYGNYWATLLDMYVQDNQHLHARSVKVDAKTSFEDPVKNSSGRQLQFKPWSYYDVRQPSFVFRRNDNGDDTEFVTTPEAAADLGMDIPVDVHDTDCFLMARRYFAYQAGRRGLAADTYSITNDDCFRMWGHVTFTEEFQQCELEFYTPQECHTEGGCTFNRGAFCDTVEVADMPSCAEYCGVVGPSVPSAGGASGVDLQNIAYMVDGRPSWSPYNGCITSGADPGHVYMYYLAEPQVYAPGDSRAGEAQERMDAEARSSGLAVVGGFHYSTMNDAHSNSHTETTHELRYVNKGCRCVKACVDGVSAFASRVAPPEGAVEPAKVDGILAGNWYCFGRLNVQIMRTVGQDGLMASGPGRMGLDHIPWCSTVLKVHDPLKNLKPGDNLHSASYVRAHHCMPSNLIGLEHDEGWINGEFPEGQSPMKEECEATQKIPEWEYGSKNYRDLADGVPYVSMPMGVDSPRTPASYVSGGMTYRSPVDFSRDPKGVAPDCIFRDIRVCPLGSDGRAVQMPANYYDPITGQPRLCRDRSRVDARFPADGSTIPQVEITCNQEWYQRTYCYPAEPMNQGCCESDANPHGIWDVFDEDENPTGYKTATGFDSFGGKDDVRRTYGMGQVDFNGRYGVISQEPARGGWGALMWTSTNRLWNTQTLYDQDGRGYITTGECRPISNGHWNDELVCSSNYGREFLYEEGAQYCVTAVSCVGVQCESVDDHDVTEFSVEYSDWWNTDSSGSSFNGLGQDGNFYNRAYISEYPEGGHRAYQYQLRQYTFSSYPSSGSGFDWEYGVLDYHKFFNAEREGRCGDGVDNYFNKCDEDIVTGWGHDSHYGGGGAEVDLLDMAWMSGGKLESARGRLQSDQHERCGTAQLNRGYVGMPDIAVAGQRDENETPTSVFNPTPECEESLDLGSVARRDSSSGTPMHEVDGEFVEDTSALHLQDDVVTSADPNYFAAGSSRCVDEGGVECTAPVRGAEVTLQQSVDHYEQNDNDGACQITPLLVSSHECGALSQGCIYFVVCSGMRALMGAWYFVGSDHANTPEGRGLGEGDIGYQKHEIHYDPQVVVSVSHESQDVVVDRVGGLGGVMDGWITCPDGSTGGVDLSFGGAVLNCRRSESGMIYRSCRVEDDVNEEIEGCYETSDGRVFTRHDDIAEMRQTAVSMFVSIEAGPKLNSAGGNSDGWIGEMMPVNSRWSFKQLLIHSVRTQDMLEHNFETCGSVREEARLATAGNAAAFSQYMGALNPMSGGMGYSYTPPPDPAIIARLEGTNCHHPTIEYDPYSSDQDWNAVSNDWWLIPYWSEDRFVDADGDVERDVRFNAEDPGRGSGYVEYSGFGDLGAQTFALDEFPFCTDEVTEDGSRLFAEGKYVDTSECCANSFGIYIGADPWIGSGFCVNVFGVVSREHQQGGGVRSVGADVFHADAYRSPELEGIPPPYDRTVLIEHGVPGSWERWGMKLFTKNVVLYPHGDADAVMRMGEHGAAQGETCLESVRNLEALHGGEIPGIGPPGGAEGPTSWTVNWSREVELAFVELNVCNFWLVRPPLAFDALLNTQYTSWNGQWWCYHALTAGAAAPTSANEVEQDRVPGNMAAFIVLEFALYPRNEGNFFRESQTIGEAFDDRVFAKVYDGEHTNHVFWHGEVGDPFIQGRVELTESGSEYGDDSSGVYDMYVSDMYMSDMYMHGGQSYHAESVGGDDSDYWAAGGDMANVAIPCPAYLHLVHAVAFECLQAAGQAGKDDPVSAFDPDKSSVTVAFDAADFCITDVHGHSFEYVVYGTPFPQANVGASSMETYGVVRDVVDRYAPCTAGNMRGVSTNVWQILTGLVEQRDSEGVSEGFTYQGPDDLLSKGYGGDLEYKYRDGSVIMPRIQGRAELTEAWWNRDGDTGHNPWYTGKGACPEVWQFGAGLRGLLNSYKFFNTGASFSSNSVMSHGTKGYDGMTGAVCVSEVCINRAKLIRYSCVNTCRGCRQPVDPRWYFARHGVECSPGTGIFSNADLNWQAPPWQTYEQRYPGHDTCVSSIHANCRARHTVHAIPRCAQYVGEHNSELYWPSGASRCPQGQHNSDGISSGPEHEYDQSHDCAYLKTVWEASRPESPYVAYGKGVYLSQTSYPDDDLCTHAEADCQFGTSDGPWTNDKHPFWEYVVPGVTPVVGFNSHPHPVLPGEFHDDTAHHHYQGEGPHDIQSFFDWLRKGRTGHDHDPLSCDKGSRRSSSFFYDRTGDMYRYTYTHGFNPSGTGPLYKPYGFNFSPCVQEHGDHFHQQGTTYSAGDCSHYDDWVDSDGRPRRGFPDDTIRGEGAYFWFPGHKQLRGHVWYRPVEKIDGVARHTKEEIAPRECAGAECKSFIGTEVNPIASGNCPYTGPEGHVREWDYQDDADGDGGCYNEPLALGDGVIDSPDYPASEVVASGAQPPKGFQFNHASNKPRDWVDSVARYAAQSRVVMNPAFYASSLYWGEDVMGGWADKWQPTEDFGKYIWWEEKPSSQVYRYPTLNGEPYGSMGTLYGYGAHDGRDPANRHNGNSFGGYGTPIGVGLGKWNSGCTDLGTISHDVWAHRRLRGSPGERFNWENRSPEEPGDDERGKHPHTWCPENTATFSASIIHFPNGNALLKSFIHGFGDYELVPPNIYTPCPGCPACWPCNDPDVDLEAVPGYENRGGGDPVYPGYDKGFAGFTGTQVVAMDTCQAVGNMYTQEVNWFTSRQALTHGMHLDQRLCPLIRDGRLNPNLYENVVIDGNEVSRRVMSDEDPPSHMQKYDRDSLSQRRTGQPVALSPEDCGPAQRPDDPAICTRDAVEDIIRYSSSDLHQDGRWDRQPHECRDSRAFIQGEVQVYDGTDPPRTMGSDGEALVSADVWRATGDPRPRLDGIRYVVPGADVPDRDDPASGSAFCYLVGLPTLGGKKFECYHNRHSGYDVDCRPTDPTYLSRVRGEPLEEQCVGGNQCYVHPDMPAGNPNVELAENGIATTIFGQPLWCYTPQMRGNQEWMGHNAVSWYDVWHACWSNGVLEAFDIMWHGDRCVRDPNGEDTDSDGGCKPFQMYDCGGEDTGFFGSVRRYDLRGIDEEDYVECTGWMASFSQISGDWMGHSPFIPGNGWKFSLGPFPMPGKDIEFTFCLWKQSVAGVDLIAFSEAEMTMHGNYDSCARGGTFDGGFFCDFADWSHVGNVYTDRTNAWPGKGAPCVVEPKCDDEPLGGIDYQTGEALGYTVNQDATGAYVGPRTLDDPGEEVVLAPGCSESERAQQPRATITVEVMKAGGYISDKYGVCPNSPSVYVDDGGYFHWRDYPSRISKEDYTAMIQLAMAQADMHDVWVDGAGQFPDPFPEPYQDCNQVTCASWLDWQANLCKSCPVPLQTSAKQATFAREHLHDNNYFYSYWCMSVELDGPGVVVMGSKTTAESRKKAKDDAQNKRDNSAPTWRHGRTKKGKSKKFGIQAGWYGFGEINGCWGPGFFRFGGRLCVGYKLGFTTPGITIPVPGPWPDLSVRLTCVIKLYGCIMVSLLLLRLPHEGIWWVDCGPHKCWARRRQVDSNGKPFPNSIWAFGGSIGFSIGLEGQCDFATIMGKVRGEMGIRLGPVMFDAPFTVVCYVQGRVCVKALLFTVCVQMCRITLLDLAVGFPLNAIWDALFGNQLSVEGGNADGNNEILNR